jgi:hypothetical protein
MSKKIHFYLLLFVWANISSSASAQNLNYRKTYRQAWETPQLPKLTLADTTTFANHDAVVLYERTEWILNTQTGNVNVQGSSLFKKFVRLQILTNAGAKKHQQITLPEPNDPTREYADLSVKERQRISRPKYFSMQIEYFHARLLKPNTPAQTLTPTDAIETERLLYNSTWRSAYAYKFNLPNVQKGDVVEIEYAYYLPYTTDWNRLFFNGSVYKLSADFVLQYPDTEYAIFEYKNNAQPTDSTQIKDGTQQYVRLNWHFDQLAGCINEPNARPYNDLPNVTYYFHNKHFGKWVDAAITDFVPYSWKYYTYDRLAFKKQQQYEIRKVLNKKETALNRFFKTYSMGQTTPLGKLQKLNNEITKNFSYQYLPDHFANTDRRLGTFPEWYLEQLLHEINRKQVYYGMFDRIDLRLEQQLDALNQIDLQLMTNAHMGITNAEIDKIPFFIRNKVLYNLNTNEIYNGLMKRLGINYYQVIVADTRIGSINAQKCMPILGEQQLFAMLDEHNNPIYLYPKNNKTGYQINELPFYLQNTTAVLVSQMVENANDDQNVLFYKTYNTTYKNNKRVTNTTANVDLSQKIIGINRQEILTGNYQNLLNGFYQHKTIDSTVNQQYYHTLKTLNPIGNLYSAQIIQQDTLLHIQQQNALANAITQLTDTTYQINLNQWVQHITTNLTNNTKRIQPYYLDFANTDTHQITLQFDHNIQLISPQKKLLSIDEQTKIGAYYLKIEQPTANTIQLTTALVIKADKILPDQIPYLQQLFEAANAVSNLNIQIALSK